MKTGKVIQVIGAAVDVQFEQEHLPAIENAVEIEMEGGAKIVAEVAQQMGDGIVRCVALESTDGKVIAANMWGKVKTVLQMLSIIFYFFGMSIASMSATGTEQGVRQILVISISMVLCWLVAAVTAISGIKYLWDNRSFINTAK